MAQHPKCPDPNQLAELIVDWATGERVGQGAGYVALVDGALVGTIMFEPGDQTGGCPGLNRLDLGNLGELPVAPERQGPQARRASGPDGGTSRRDGRGRDRPRHRRVRGPPDRVVRTAWLPPDRGRSLGAHQRLQRHHEQTRPPKRWDRAPGQWKRKIRS